MTKHLFRKAVLAILVNDQGKILIGSSPRDGGYKLPQGGLDPGEDPISGVKRELLEELALAISDRDIEVLHRETVQYLYPPEDPYYIYKGQRLHVFKINYSGNEQVVPQDDEFDKLYWIDPKELDNFDVGFRLEAYKRALYLCELLRF